MNKWLLSGMAVISLAGCAALSYQEPQSGARARVRFATTTTWPTVLRAYDDTNCSQNESEWMRLRNGPLAQGRLKTLGMPLWNHQQNAAKEVYVDAGKTMNGMFFGGEVTGYRMVQQCGVPFSFPFAENHDYEVRYHFTPGQCHVTISEIVPNGTGWSYRPLKRFENRASEGCARQFSKIRWD